MQLSIIIVNYNVKYFLEQCLHSVARATENLDVEVWVVDNASSDESVSFLHQQFPWVQVIANGNNPGFAKANNQALAKCSGQYILYLNPDTLLPEDCLVKAMAFLAADPLAGALGIRMIDGSGRFLPESKRSFPSPLTSLSKLSGFSALFPRSKLFGRYALTYLNDTKNWEVDVLAGAFMLVKRELLTSLQGFDEDFFMYGEDIDLSYRIQKSGYKNFYFGASTIIHFKGESTHKGSLNYVKMFYTAMNIFVKKHYPNSSARYFVFLLQGGIAVRAGISALARIAKKGWSSKVAKEKLNARQLPKETWVIGNEDEYNEVLQLYAKAGQEKRIAGRIEPKDMRVLHKTLAVRQTKNSTKGSSSEIVFCSGALSYKQIIALVQQMPAGVAFRFHGAGTKSIIGSDSKNTAGIFIA